MSVLKNLLTIWSKSGQEIDVGSVFDNSDADNPKVQTSQYSKGNPMVIAQDCTVAGQEYPIDIQATLGRNAHLGFIKAKSTNLGSLSVAFSSDGVTFTGFFDDIKPGDSMDIDGLDLAAIKVKAANAGDDLIGEVH